MDILDKINMFLNESVETDEILKNCKPFLTQASEPLWHGTNSSLPFLNKLRVRKTPKNMRKILHELFDDAFNNVFGFRVRTDAIFCSGDKKQANSYGTPYAIFPKGNFKYVWSPTITDLFVTIRDDNSKSNSDLVAIRTYLEAYDELNRNEFEDSTWKHPKYTTPEEAWNDLQPNILKYITNFIKANYKSTNLSEALGKRREVMIHCEEFYALSNEQNIAEIFSNK